MSKLTLIMLVLSIHRGIGAATPPQGEASTRRPARDPGACTVVYLNVRSQASFGTEFDLTLCQARGQALAMEAFEYSRRSDQGNRRVLRSTTRTLSKDELDEWMATLFEALRHEKYANFAKPGLIQLDGANFLIELRVGLLHILVELNGSENDQENSGSTLLTWIVKRKGVFR